MNETSRLFSINRKKLLFSIVKDKKDAETRKKYKKLEELIENHGGKTVNIPTEKTINLVILNGKNNYLNSQDENLFDSKFIMDCIKLKKLQRIESYRINNNLEDELTESEGEISDSLDFLINSQKTAMENSLLSDNESIASTLILNGNRGISDDDESMNSSSSETCDGPMSPGKSPVLISSRSKKALPRKESLSPMNWTGKNKELVLNCDKEKMNDKVDDNSGSNVINPFNMAKRKKKRRLENGIGDVIDRKKIKNQFTAGQNKPVVEKKLSSGDLGVYENEEKQLEDNYSGKVLSPSKMNKRNIESNDDSITRKKLKKSNSSPVSRSNSRESIKESKEKSREKKTQQKVTSHIQINQEKSSENGEENTQNKIKEKLRKTSKKKLTSYSKPGPLSSAKPGPPSSAKPGPPSLAEPGPLSSANADEHTPNKTTETSPKTSKKKLTNCSNPEPRSSKFLDNYLELFGKILTEMPIPVTPDEEQENYPINNAKNKNKQTKELQVNLKKKSSGKRAIPPNKKVRSSSRIKNVFPSSDLQDFQSKRRDKKSQVLRKKNIIVKNQQQAEPSEKQKKSRDGVRVEIVDGRRVEIPNTLETPYPRSWMVGDKLYFRSDLNPCPRNYSGIKGQSFHEWEEDAMVRFLVENKQFHGLPKLTVCRKMLESTSQELCDNRTEASLVKHWTNHILLVISKFELPAHIESIITGKTVQGEEQEEGQQDKTSVDKGKVRTVIVRGEKVEIPCSLKKPYPYSWMVGRKLYFKTDLDPQPRDYGGRKLINRFQEWELNAMIRFVYERDYFNRSGSISVWKEMIQTNAHQLCVDRSAYTLQCYWSKHIVENISKLELPEEIMSKLTGKKSKRNEKRKSSSSSKSEDDDDQDDDKIDDDTEDSDG